VYHLHSELHLRHGLSGYLHPLRKLHFSNEVNFHSFPEGMGTFSRVDSLISSSWFSFGDIAVFLVLRFWLFL